MNQASNQALEANFLIALQGYCTYIDVQFMLFILLPLLFPPPCNTFGKLLTLPLAAAYRFSQMSELYSMKTQGDVSALMVRYVLEIGLVSHLELVLIL